MMIKRIKTILLTAALVAAVSGLAVAQNGDYNDNNRGNHDQDSNRQWGQNRGADAREYGFHNGYRAGFDRARNFRNTRGNNGGYNNNDGYNNGNNNGDYNNDGYGRNRMNDTDGYQTSMGSRGQYKKGYREGYRTGYNDASSNRPAQYPYV